MLSRSPSNSWASCLMTTWHPYSIGYRCSIVTESLSPAVCEIFSPKHIGVTTHATSLITWRFDSPYVVSYWRSIENDPLSSISYKRSIVTDSLSPAVFEILGPKHIGVTTLTFPYLQAFSRYLAPNISGSRPWPFEVTWRHWSCDHLMPHIAFPIGVPL